MLSIHDVSLRKKILYEEPKVEKLNIPGLLKSINERYNYNIIETVTKNSIQLPGDEDDRLRYMLDRLDEVCENETSFKTKQYTKLICEQLKLIKHAKNVANSIKGHLSSIKAKITGNNKQEQNKARQAVGMDKLETTSSGKVTSKDIKNNENIKKQQQKKNKLNQENSKDEVKMECYQMLLNEANNIIAYDRVWKTHNRINERFNTRKIFDEAHSNVDECVKEFCMLLDTYDVPFRAKVNICLENIAYEYDRNNKAVDKEALAESVTRYFLLHNSTFSEQMIVEEANQQTMIDKMLKICKRLAKSSNAAAVNIANKVYNALTSIGKLTKQVGVFLLDVLGTVLGGIIMLVGILVVGATIAVGLVGTIILLITLAIGIITIILGVQVTIVISPSKRKEFIDACDKIKKTHGKKHKKLNRAMEKLANALNIQLSEHALMESFCECEYNSKCVDMEYVLKTNKFYSENDIRKAMDLLTEPDEKPKLNYTLEDTILGITEDNKPSKKNSISDKMKSIFNIAHKSPSMLKEKIKDLYTNSPDEVIDETPNIFAILVDVCIIAGSFAINPVLGIISGMTLWFIGMKANREQSEKYIKKFKKEKEKAEKRKLTGSAKERNDAYIAQLTKSIEKLEDYRNDLHTEEENEEREAKENPSTDDSGSDDFSFGDDDDLKIESVVDIKIIDKAISILEQFKTNDVYQYLRRNDINPSALDYIVREGCKSGVLNRDKMYTVLEEVANANRKDVKKWNMFRRGMKTLKEETYIGHNLYNRASVAIDIYDIINEMSIGNHLTMLIDKVKRGASNLSDKEKIASRTLDTTLENLRQSMEKALTQENREAVIRGDILPSASRIIKLALVSGFTFLINPALTVIYLLGVFAMSRNIRAKERQLVLDEIDTEIKVCKEYMEEAKNKRDMNSYRQCLQIEKKLLRQRDTLNYKMKIAYNQETQTNFSADKEK